MAGPAVAALFLMAGLADCGSSGSQPAYRVTHVPGYVSSVSCGRDGSCLALAPSAVSLRQRTSGLSLRTGGSVEASFRAVSCLAPRHCAAVGAAAGDPVIGVLNGRHWKTHPPANGAVRFIGISCRRRKACMVTGFLARRAQAAQPYLAWWRGGHLHRLHVPAPDGAASTWLESASCTPLQCMAVGWFFDRRNLYHPLAVTVSHRRVVEYQPPVPANAPAPQLHSVSCVSSGECWAVGDYGPGVGTGAGFLIERWMSGSWTLVPGPRLAAHPHIPELWSVSCRTGHACVASGDVELGSVPEGEYQAGIALRWDGVRWRLVAAVGSLSESAALVTVSCPRSQACAVGGYSNDGTGRTPLLGLIHDDRLRLLLGP